MGRDALARLGCRPRAAGTRARSRLAGTRPADIIETIWNNAGVIVESIYLFFKIAFLIGAVASFVILGFIWWQHYQIDYHKERAQARGSVIGWSVVLFLIIAVCIYAFYKVPSVEPSEENARPYYDISEK